MNSWYLNKPDEDWYWPVEISQLNSTSRCLIRPCKSLLDCNIFNFIYFDWSRSFWIRRWARLFVHGFCCGILTSAKHSILNCWYQFLVHSFSSANQYVAMRSFRFPARKLDSQLAIRNVNVFIIHLPKKYWVCFRALTWYISSCVKRSPLLWNPVGVEGEGLGACYIWSWTFRKSLSEA